MTPEVGTHVVAAVGEETVWRLAGALARSTTPLEVAESLAEDGGPAVGGSFVNLAVLVRESNFARVFQRAGPGNRGAVEWDDLNLGERTPAMEAMRLGLPVLLASREELGRRYPHLLDETVSAGLHARVSVPLRSADDVIVGALGLAWAQPQEFSAAQLRRLDLIAQLAGLALGRTLGGDPGLNAEHLLPRVLETMPNGFLSMDIELRINYVNPVGETLLRASREDLVGRRLVEAFPAAAGGEFERQYLQALRTREPAVFEEYSVALGSWFEVHVWPDQHGINIYFSNIDERRSAERQRTLALSEAQQANQRLSLLTELSALLTGANSQAEVFERVTRAVVPALADWCTIVVPEGDELVRVAAAHRQPALNGLAKRLVGRYPHAFSGPSPGVVVYRSGQPLRLARLAQQIVADLDDSVASAAYGRTLHLLGDGPGLITPVAAHGKVVAVLTTVRAGGEPFTDLDVATMEAVAARMAASLDDAGQVETQRATASALQAAALPTTLPSSERLALAAAYRGASEGTQVGGDWYDAFELENGRIALVVGDMAGHGLQAAAVMAQMRNALRAHLFASLGPSESLTRLSRLLATQEPRTFATIVCAEVDPLTGEATWASAGHFPPVLVRADGSSAHLPGHPTPPVGYIEEVVPVEFSLTLRPGDRLLMFTDGLVERRGIDPEIGLTHFSILAEQAGGAGATAACELIFRNMLADAHEDDACLLIADYLPSPAAT